MFGPAMNGWAISGVAAARESAALFFPWSFRSSSAGRDDGGGLPTRRYGGVAGPQSDLPILQSYYEVVWIIRVK